MNNEVKDKIVQNLTTILTCFKTALAKTSEPFFGLVITHINKYHSGVQNNWRRLENYFSHFQHFHKYFSKEQIIETFIPILRKQIFEGVAIPVKLQAALSLVILTRGLHNLSRQKDIFNSLIKELVNSKSWCNRMMFFDLCHPIMEHFSRKFSKEILFENVMKLEKDKIANVRRRFCFMLPELKQTLTLPDDVILLAKIKEKLSYLSLDKDRDVKEAAVSAKNILSMIETETNRGFRLNLQTQDDINDKRKEREEQEWPDKDFLMTSPVPVINSANNSPPSTTSGPRKRPPATTSNSKTNLNIPTTSTTKTKSPSPSPTPSNPVKPTTNKTVSTVTIPTTTTPKPT